MAAVLKQRLELGAPGVLSLTDMSAIQEPTIIIIIIIME